MFCTFAGSCDAYLPSTATFVLKADMPAAHQYFCSMAQTRTHACTRVCKALELTLSHRHQECCEDRVISLDSTRSPARYVSLRAK